MPAALGFDVEMRDLVQRALAEDIGTGDATTLALVPAEAEARAAILTRRACRVAGGSIAAEVFQQLDRKLDIRQRVADGADADAGQTILEIRGALRPILTGERTALNFMQRLCGIATLTAEFVRRAGNTRLRILDTRKTTPTLRRLEKYAVRCGGGCNHRFGLFDMILIKDNHRRFWEKRGGLAAAIRAARQAYPALPIEAEVENEGELQKALSAKPDWILLDNMPPDLLRKCVNITAGRCRLEASGGITLANITEIAATGVDAVSLGCLTHSAPAVDLTLEILD